MSSLSNSDLRQLAKQNAANIEAIAKRHSADRALKGDVEKAGALAKAFGFGDTRAEKSDSDELAEQIQRNAENLAILAAELDVPTRKVDGKATKGDMDAVADAFLGGEQ